MITFSQLMRRLMTLAWDFEYRAKYDKSAVAAVLNEDREVSHVVIQFLILWGAVSLVETDDDVEVYFTASGVELMREIDEFRKECGLDL